MQALFNLADMGDQHVTAAVAVRLEQLTEEAAQNSGAVKRQDVSETGVVTSIGTQRRCSLCLWHFCTLCLSCRHVFIM